MTHRERKYLAAKRQRRRGYYCPFPADFNRLSGAIIVDRVGHKIPLITDGEIYDQAALMSILPLPEHWRNQPFPTTLPKMGIMLPGGGLRDVLDTPVPHIEFYEGALKQFNHVVRDAKPPIVWASLECRGPLSNSNGGLKKATDFDRKAFEQMLSFPRVWIDEMAMYRVPPILYWSERTQKEYPRRKYYLQLSLSDRIALKEWLHWPGRKVMTLSEFLSEKDEEEITSEFLVRDAVLSGRCLQNGDYQEVIFEGKRMFAHKRRQLKQRQWAQLQLNMKFFLGETNNNTDEKK